MAPRAEDGDIAWRPSEAICRAANWTQFIAALGVADYAELCRVASSDPERFWRGLADWLDFPFPQRPQRMLDLSEGLAHPRWCLGGTTNLALATATRWAARTPTREAVVWEGESGQRRAWSYAELEAQSSRLAAGLHRLGLREGEVVAIYLPMLPETAAAFLACAKLGCIVLPLFSGFGADAIVQRCRIAGAVALITATSTSRRGQMQPMAPVVDQALAALPSIRHVIVLPTGGESGTDNAAREIAWPDLVQDAPETWPARVLPAEHPALLMFTSGTTGLPKGCVHTHAGLGLKLGQDARLTLDLNEGDRLLWPTDFGWFGGTITVLGALMAGATLVIAEGAPTWPDPARLWRILARERVTHFGTAPTLARILRREADAVRDGHDLSALRVIPSSGEAWDRDSWLWVMRRIGEGRAPIMNFSGGTEMCALVASNILFPQKPGSFNGAVPGTGADIVRPDGTGVAPGEIGELVMREACIGTTRGLWHDEERYLASYWQQTPGMWTQGDLASRDTDGFWFLHGRSDDTIKVSGKRIGPSEIEDAVMATGLVMEVAAVALPDPVTGASVTCVVVALPGPAPEAALIQQAVAAALGASFRPRRVVFVQDLPKTRSMKVMRRVVRSVLAGLPEGDLSSLVNPDSVEALRDLALP